MCRVYNTIGCLNTIQFHLVKNNIDEFNSLNELISFRKNYHINEQKIISDHTSLIEKEKITLEKELSELNIVIPKRENDLKEELKERLDYYNQEIENLPQTNSKIIPIIKDYWINLVLCTKFWLIQLIYYFKVIFFKYQAKKMLSKKNKRFEYLALHFQNAVKESSVTDFKILERKKEVIESLNNTIYGALGEQKVENILRKLSDDYILINDFCCSFNPPIKHKNDSIKSIQIDHLLISPSGIFLIETKNWSKNSIDNLDLRSPVQQVLRTNFALYKILTEKINKSNLFFSRNHWGNRKIPIKNIIVFSNNKPFEEFEFVKILTLRELLNYIGYFNHSFTTNETVLIAEFLLSISEHTEVSSKLVI
ncbi:nuclease-related domain-containing protein [Flavobacterium ajazii]|uniref:nuclease-related domain-containing protein n=1 Tax=Flavobacterium ajazii TaxID=2692318 RepID=UPI0013D40434|nr:nuclease-related domain-containing protein [Flavobacterium ajazii]